MDIFVASLPFKVKEPELRKIFEDFGEVVSVKFIKDDKGLNKGFGFVSMPNAVEANAAMKALNGFELGGRKLIVSRSEQTNASKNKRSYTSEGAMASKRVSKSSYADFKGKGKPSYAKRGSSDSRPPEFKKYAGDKPAFKRGGSDNQGTDKRTSAEGGKSPRFGEPREERAPFKRGTGKAPFEKREPRTERGGEFKKSSGGKGGFKSASASKSPYKKRAASSGPKKSGGGRRGR